MTEESTRIGEAELRMALRGLRLDIEPGHDLWPGIAARLQSQPQQSGQTSRRSRPGWSWPFALAASLLLAVGLAWHIKPVKPAANVVPVIAQASPVTRALNASLMQREADNMTLHYESALREMEGQPLPAGWQPGLDALDRSAIEIRTAMQHDPNSRLLLERLRATYTRRLVLSRRALYA